MIQQKQTIDLLDSMLWDPNNYPIDVFTKHSILFPIPCFHILDESELKGIANQGT